MDEGDKLTTPHFPLSSSHTWQYYLFIPQDTNHFLVHASKVKISCFALFTFKHCQMLEWIAHEVVNLTMCTSARIKKKCYTINLKDLHNPRDLANEKAITYLKGDRFVSHTCTNYLLYIYILKDHRTPTFSI